VDQGDLVDCTVSQVEVGRVRVDSAQLAKEDWQINKMGHSCACSSCHKGWEAGWKALTMTLPLTCVNACTNGNLGNGCTDDDGNGSRLLGIRGLLPLLLHVPTHHQRPHQGFDLT
jgi:hypothetical protein